MRALRGTILLALLVPAAHAHDARPLSITLIEQTDGIYRSVVRVPPTVDPGNRPRIEWTRQCETLEAAALRSAAGTASVLACAGGIEGATVAIDYPLYNPSITTLIRLETLRGASMTAVLPPDELRWTAPEAPTRFAVGRDYTMLGFAHIWDGPDHLLFVLGLLLLARVPRRIFWAVTGFTAAHSMTLSLAAIGVVNVPIAPVEAMIALSILFLAAEIARNDPTSFSRRYPIALSFVFGLLHGFGFASALGEIGLPRFELATGLLFFNVGVELGQLAFIALCAALVIGYRLVAARLPRSAGPTSGYAARTGAYCLGIPAAFWFIARTTAAFA